MNQNSKNIVNDKMKNIKFYSKKEEAYQTESSFYIARDIGTKGAKEFGCVNSITELINLTKNNDNLYEIIKEDFHRVSCFDIDCKYTDCKDLLPDVPFEEQKNWILEIFKLALEDFKYCNDSITGGEDVNLVVTCSSIPSKFSFHINDRRCWFSDNKDWVIYHQYFLKYLNDQIDSPGYLLLSKIVDGAIYSKCRCMRMLGQSKNKKGAETLKLISNHSIEDTFITYCHDKDNGVEVKPPNSWFKKKKKITPVIAEKNENISEEIEMLIKHLGDTRFAEYDLWYKLVWCLHAVGFSVNEIHTECCIRSPDNYTEEGIDSLIQQYNHDKNRYSISTLKKWAFEDTGYESERFVDYKEPILSERDSEYYFSDLQNELHFKKESLDFPEWVSKHRNSISKVCNLIQAEQNYFLCKINDDSPYVVRKDLPIICCGYKTGLGKNGEDVFKCDGPVVNARLDNIMNLHNLNFPKYNKMVFKPNDHNLRKGEKNTWAGFKAKEVDEIDMDMDKIKIILDHIYYVWADSNDEYYKYIISWFANIFQKPYQQTGIALLVQGAPGTGKTLLCNFLIDFVFGRPLSLATTGLEPLTQRFNACIQSKLFINANELQTVGENSFSNSWESMKALITDKIIQIERKGLEHVTIENNSNYFLTTNNYHTAKIEQGDRRYACFSASDCRKGNDDYFNELVDSFTQENANMFFSYLLRLPKDEMTNIKKIPKTELRESMMNATKTSVHRFVEIMDEELDEAVLYDWINDGKKAVSCTNFYLQYKCWCTDNGEKIWSNKSVGVELKNKQLYKSIDRTQKNKIRKRCYSF